MIKLHNTISCICAIAATTAMTFAVSCGGDDSTELVFPSVPATNRLMIDTTSMKIKTSAAFTMASGTSVAFSWESIPAKESWKKGFLTFDIPKEIYGKQYTFGSGSETFTDMKPAVSYKANGTSAEVSASESGGGITGTIEYKTFSAAFAPQTSTTVSFWVKYDITFDGKRFQGGYEGAVQRTMGAAQEEAILVPFNPEFLAEDKNPTPKTPTNSLTIGKKTIPQADLAPSFQNRGENMLDIDLGKWGSITLPVVLQGHTIDLTKYYYPFTSLDHNWKMLLKDADWQMEISGDEIPENSPIKSGYLHVSSAKGGKIDLALDITFSDDSKVTGDLPGIGQIAQ